MSSRPVIVTPRLIRRHNVRCFGRSFLWLLGSASVFLIGFLFLWVLASLVTGSRQLSWPIALGASFFALAVFVAGHFYLKKHGPQDWERIAQKPDRQPGMRLSRMSNQEYGQIGQGFFGLILAGPGWLGRIGEEMRSLIPTSEESASELEDLRQHLAAREGWVPLKDFAAYEKKIYLLAKLNMISIRELVGAWHFHVTVKGTVNRTRAVEIDS
jgi:hypothetical protein